MGYEQMHHQTQILVLGSDGAGRSALEETLTRLGYVVLAADASAHENPPASGDIVMLDLRGDDADWRQLAEGLHADDRPMMIISERPRRLVRSLSGRAACTMVMTGAESDAGYRVALSVCSALRRTAVERRGRTGISVAAI
jgi:CheY-like chemotaxis protein